MTRFTLIAIVVLPVVLTSNADAAPPDLKGKSLADTFAEVLPKLEKDNGAQQRWQDVCFALGAPGNEKMRAEACTLMAARLDPKSPAATRLWLLQQLQRIGREEAVEGLAAVLTEKNDEIREAAVRAMANNPSPQATEKLAANLPGAKGAAKIGLLNALGHRGDSTAVAAVTKELNSDDDAVVVAAARALGRIPGFDSLESLNYAGVKAKGTIRKAIGEALLVHADRLQKSSKPDEKKIASQIYAALNRSDEPRPIRLASLRGRIQTSGDKAGELVLSILAGEDASASAVAVGQIENLSAGALKPLAAKIDSLPVPSRVLVITAIAARGDRSQLPVALAAAKSDNADVKRAGVLAIGRLGDASAVEFLLDVMSGKDATAGIAAESLATLSAEGVNEKLIAVLEAANRPERAVALIGILERRKAVAAVPAILKTAGGTDPSVRTAAFIALKSLSTREHVSDMIPALLKTEKGKEREAAEVAIAAVCAQLAPEKRAESVLAAIKSDSRHTADLLPLLGRLGGAEAITLIHENMKSDDATRRDAAARALLNWPDPAANGDLLTLAESANDRANRVRAILALIRINAVLIDRTPEERLAALGVMKRAMPLATRDEERRAILEGLGNIRHIETLRFVVPYLDQQALAQAACKGVVELAHSKILREPNKAEFEKALDLVIAICKDKALVGRAKQYKEGC